MILADTDLGPTIGHTEFCFPTGLVIDGVYRWAYGFCDDAAVVAEITAQSPAPIPTVSEWGMVFIVLLVLTGGTIILRRSRRAIAA